MRGEGARPRPRRGDRERASRPTGSQTLSHRRARLAVPSIASCVPSVRSLHASTRRRRRAPQRQAPPRSRAARAGAGRAAIEDHPTAGSCGDGGGHTPQRQGVVAVAVDTHRERQRAMSPRPRSEGDEPQHRQPDVGALRSSSFVGHPGSAAFPSLYLTALPPPLSGESIQFRVAEARGRSRRHRGAGCERREIDGNDGRDQQGSEGEAQLPHGVGAERCRSPFSRAGRRQRRRPHELALGRVCREDLPPEHGGCHRPEDPRGPRRGTEQSRAARAPPRSRRASRRMPEDRPSLEPARDKDRIESADGSCDARETLAAQEECRARGPRSWE